MKNHWINKVASHYNGAVNQTVFTVRFNFPVPFNELKQMILQFGAIDAFQLNNNFFSVEMCTQFVPFERNMNSLGHFNHYDKGHSK